MKPNRQSVCWTAIKEWLIETSFLKPVECKCFVLKQWMCLCGYAVTTQCLLWFLNFLSNERASVTTPLNHLISTCFPFHSGKQYQPLVIWQLTCIALSQKRELGPRLWSRFREIATMFQFSLHQSLDLGTMKVVWLRF